MLRVVLGLVLVLALAGCKSEPPAPEPAPSIPEAPSIERCAICGALLDARPVDLGPGFAYHTSCWDRAILCDGCGLPVTGTVSRWKDGRITCAACRRDAILEPADARRLVDEARALLRKTVGLDARGIEVPVKLVGRPELLADAREVSGPAVKAFTGVTEDAPSSDGSRGARRYRIVALYGLPRAELIAILGHELFHVLQVERSGAERDPAFREGAATYVQVILLRALGQDVEARLLEKETNPTYGEGLRRFEALVKARGEREALELGLRSVAFPRGF